MSMQTDRRFARHPWHVLFFTVLAINAYALLFMGLLGAVAPSMLERLIEPELNDVHLLWTVQVLMQALIFVHVSIWAEHIGVGPFAGRLQSSFRWLLAALILAPIVNILIQLGILYFLQGGEVESVTRSETFNLMTQPESINLMMLVALVLLAPLLEEVVYRGVGIGFLLARGMPELLAVIVMAFAFSMVHGQYTLAGMVSVFFLGVFLGWLRIRSKSIGPPLVAHMVINLQAVLAIVASGAADVV